MTLLGNDVADAEKGLSDVIKWSTVGSGSTKENQDTVKSSLKLKGSRNTTATAPTWWSWAITGFRHYALFGYFTPYMRQAKELGGAAVRPEALPPLKKRDDINYWSTKFSTAADHEWSRPNGPSSIALFRVVWRVYWKYIIAIFLFKVVKIGLDVWSSRFLKGFLSWQEKKQGTVSAAERTKGVLHGLAVVAIQLLCVFLFSQFHFWTERIMMRLEGSLATCLFRRTLVSKRGPHTDDATATKHSESKVVREPASTYNLLMIDVPSIARSTCTLIDLLVLPVGLYWCFRELRNNIGASAEVGLYVIGVIVAIILLSELYNGYLKKPLLHWRDVRLHHLHEVLSNIRSLRITGWQNYAAAEVDDARSKELRVRRVRMYVHGVSWALSDCTRYILQLTIFTSYVIWGLRSEPNFVFQASVVMPAFQLVMRILGPLSDCSFLLHSLLEGAVSCFRYQAHVFGFAGSPLRPSCPTTHRERENTICGLISLDGEDDQPLTSGNSVDQTKPLLTSTRRSSQTPASTPQVKHFKSDPAQCINVDQALFTWLSDPTDDEAINESQFIAIPHLEVRRGQCVLLLGHPGSGKSSAIMALLGEMRRVKGEARVRRSWRPIVNGANQVVYPVTKAEKNSSSTAVGYASQTPWLSDGTVQSAILLGRPYDEKRYARVIRACELEPDFAFWPDNDQRSIVQGGLALSAGQRARVSLARALYDFPVTAEALHTVTHQYTDKTGHQGCATFFLDDVFSSLDPTVGSQVFQHLVGGGDADGLLKHAGTLMTIDQQNLCFFLKTLRENPQPASVQFIGKIIDRGVVSDFPLDSLLHSTPLLDLPLLSSTPTEQTGLNEETSVDKITKDENSVFTPSFAPCKSQLSSPVDAASSSAVPAENTAASKKQAEGVHRGGIGLSSHWWYIKQSGVKLMALIILFVVFFTINRLASDLWLAHWAGMDQQAARASSVAVSQQNTSASFLQMNFDVPFTPSQHLSLSSQNSILDSTVPNLYSDVAALVTTRYTPTNLLYASLPSAYELQDSSPASLPFYSYLETNETVIKSVQPQAWWTLAPVDTKTALAVFIWVTVSVIFCSLLLTLCTTWAALRAAVVIHKKLLAGVINAPFWIYDALPVGMILNRFSSDIQAVDTSPLFHLNRMLMSFVHLVLIIVVLCLVRPSCCIVALVVGWIVYTFVYTLYRPSFRELQRSTLLAWSPLCSNLSEAESGNSVIRALGAQSFYIRKNRFLTSEMMKTQFMHNGVLRWATTRLQLLASCFTILNSVVPIILALIGLETLQQNSLSKFFTGKSFVQTAAFVGLSATYAMELPRFVGDLVLNVSFLDKVMCSAQRVQGFIQMTNEAQQSTKTGAAGLKEKDCIKTVDAMPLTRTGLHIDNVEIAYRMQFTEDITTDPVQKNCQQGKPSASLYYPPAVKHFSAFVQAGEHVGVIGRTGAGKSTLLLSLLDLAPVIKGSISIDGVPLSQIHPKVRTKIVGVLPQVPLVMKGWTVRRFLDPTHEYDGATLMRAITNVHMTRVIASLPNGLETVIVKDELDDPTQRSESCSADDSRHACLSVCVDTPDEHQTTSTHWLTDTQLRMLSIARLSLGADQYRLVLMDEPPTKQIGYLRDDETKRLESAIDVERDVEDIEIGPLLRQLFPNTTVIIAAHYASTIQHCDSVWVISRGQLHKTVAGSELSSQEDLMHLIKDAETSVLA